MAKKKVVRRRTTAEHATGATDSVVIRKIKITMRPPKIADITNVRDYYRQVRGSALGEVTADPALRSLPPDLQKMAIDSAVRTDRDEGAEAVTRADKWISEPHGMLRLVWLLAKQHTPELEKWGDALELFNPEDPDKAFSADELVLLGEYVDALSAAEELEDLLPPKKPVTDVSLETIAKRRRRIHTRK